MEEKLISLPKTFVTFVNKLGCIQKSNKMCEKYKLKQKSVFDISNDVFWWAGVIDPGTFLGILHY
jgi:hypothetical protein